jgi:hypothetical protein
MSTKIIRIIYSKTNVLGLNCADALATMVCSLDRTIMFYEVCRSHIKHFL